MELYLYSSQAATVFTESGASEVVVHRSAEGNDHYLVLVIPTRSPEDASNVVDFLYESAIADNLTKTELGATGKNEAGQLSGSWYTSGSVAVSVLVSQPLDGDPDDLEQRLRDTVDLLQDPLPNE